MGFSLRAKEDTWLKMSTAQGSTLPDSQRSLCKAGTTFPLAAYKLIANHLQVTFGTDEKGQQVFVQARTTWYVYAGAVEVLRDGKVINVTAPAASGEKSGEKASAQTLSTNDQGLTLVKSFEGLRLTAYQDAVGVWTIGYGTTDGVKPGMQITEQQAEDFLRRDIARFEPAVASLVKVPLTSDQFSALVSFVYNLGPGSLQQSTLLRLLNQGNIQGAADEFPRWNKAGGRVLAGLTRRRNAERALFLGQDIKPFL
jgi:GH24 family phage-related lysozyme (muramidase)